MFVEVEDNLESSVERLRRGFSLRIAFFQMALKLLLVESLSALPDAPEVSALSTDCCVFSRCINHTDGHPYSSAEKCRFQCRTRSIAANICYMCVSE